MFLRPFLVLLFSLCAAASRAAPAPFDLAGPELTVQVSRGGVTLPIASVPNLAVGDRIHLKADLPATQSARYLMVLAFLSGATNPPPEKWFHACKTWKGKCAREGLSVAVPEGAQQALVFLAPATGGDFDTLVSAVRGRPGAFVRSTQDLNQAALDRARLQRYLNTIRELDHSDPTRLKQAAPLLARSLAIRVDEKCLDRLPPLQAPCLMSGQESLILSDGHSLSLVEALASSPGYDLLLEVSSTPQAGYGYYSPYINSVVDLARILDSFSTARYQYIPALAATSGSRMALTLNTAPSFQPPYSVLVAALPAVEAPQLPPLHAVAPQEIYCASQHQLVLPVEGAPLVFATDFAHGIHLAVTDREGRTLHLPARPDGVQGGYVVDTRPLHGAPLGDTVRAQLVGRWGFEPYQGPGFQLRNRAAQGWALATPDAQGLLVGRTETIQLQAESVSCVDHILLRDPAGKELRTEWRRTQPNQVEVQLPLQDTPPGALTLLIRQHGAEVPQPVPLRAFANVGRLDGFSLHAGELSGMLTGTRLDEVTALSLAGARFTPGALATPRGGDTLTLHATEGEALAALQAGQTLTATATLRDGRSVAITARVLPPRPRVVRLAHSVQASGESALTLADDAVLPLGGLLRFSLRAEEPSRFPREQTIEVATADGSVSTTLSLANGGLRLEGARVAVATLDAAKAFGASVFGPLQFRPVLHGVAGQWQALTTLVRLPQLQALRCPANPEQACRLSGSDLFLLAAVADTPGFERAAVVPDGFPGSSLPVPRPVEGHLYARLRDDPERVVPLQLTVTELPLP